MKYRKMQQSKFGLPVTATGSTQKILIDLILKHNLSKFNNDHYLLIRITAMDTIMAPANTHISMDAVETSFLSACPLKTCIYYSYIDDIFLIWPHDNDTLTHFLEHANNTHANMKFALECSKATMPFLDVLVQKRHDKMLATLLKKSTDSHICLHYTYCHMVHIKDSIIFSQFIRYKRICTRNTDFVEHSKELTTHLLHTSQPIKVMLEQWNKVTKISRTELLEQKLRIHRTVCFSYRCTIRPLFPSTKPSWKKRSATVTSRPPSTCSTAQLYAHIDDRQI